MQTKALLAPAHFRTLYLITIVLASFFIAGFVSSNAHANVAGWNAGRIMDDSVFVNNASMNTAQIQAFLNSKVPVCDTNGTQPSEFGGGTRAQWAAARGHSPPFTCLKDFSEGGKSSAQIIFDAAQEFRINPQVLIVLLQKEQSLITDTWPIPGSSQYRTATGYGCPDTAPCASQYFGLTNQLRWSARMFRAIMNASPTWFTPYVVGNNFIQFSPNAACGGTVVNIQNRATQALYNYTPYQPNPATLAAGWGQATCGAYGNRNFYLYFQEWFGNTTGPDYAASFKPAVLYIDESLTQPVPRAVSKYIVTPGQPLFTRLEAINVGRAQWSLMTNLGTSNLRDRLSSFQAPSWLSPQRPAALNSQPISANESGLFDLELVAPSDMSTYSESFGIVQDGIAWLDDTTTFNIQVATPAVGIQNYTLHRLTPGNELLPGQVLVSRDGYSALHLRQDGLLKLQTDSQVKWTPPSAGSDAKLVMQPDGNLVLYSKQGNAIWNSGTSGNSGASAFVQEDGNFVIYTSSGTEVWSSATSIGISHLQFPHNSIHRSEIIYSGQSLQSHDRAYKLALQTDGNLVLYSVNRAIWASGTAGKTAQKLVMQPDGNLVLYNQSGSALWSSGTAGKSTSALFVQKDGNLVVYNGSGPTWSSRTSGQF